MSKPKWTPEPWVNDDGLVTGQESRERFTGQTSLDIFDASQWPEELADEAEATAHLIAAAPDLYEALETALNFIANTENELGVTLDSGDLARMALAKARGET
ncbi:hypothetical protein ACLB6G_20515 [Zhengella sp. ZM62]|uniref:hypothetical protein n=1 Tax=Zhengella sedimenti TaxID=3390035 RepID=UPI003975A905